MSERPALNARDQKGTAFYFRPPLSSKYFGNGARANLNRQWSRPQRYIIWSEAMIETTQWYIIGSITMIETHKQGYIIPKTVSHRWSRPLWYIIRLAAMIETRNGTSYWYYKPRIKATTAYHPTSQLSMIETYESTIKMWLKPGGYIPRSDDQRWRPYGRIITTNRSHDQCAN